VNEASFKADYSGKVVLVTGAASGISRTTALAYAAAGGTVLATDRDSEGAAATVDTIRATGGTAKSYTMDITCAKAVQATVDDAVARFGKIDCAFNGAAVGSPIGGTIADYDESDWDFVMNVNVRGMFLAMRAQVRQMLAQGHGNIVNVASIGGSRATPKAPAYIASKHAVIGLTRATALDHAGQGIRINAICPGYIGGTKMMDSFIDKDPEVRTAYMNSAIPIGRLGYTSEIANTALWLGSGAAAFVTGATIYVDGGLTTG
jgi:NAD(P)-dependent dehydrogenase (short-subunit alcohol dehydrogenase family)